MMIDPTAGVLAGVLGVLPGEPDEHPVAALTNTQPTATATRTGANTPTVLPFTGLNTPLAVAVDTAGNVYVADKFNNRVLKLPAQ